MDFDLKDFQKDVIEKSYNTPVLVDFWASWCQPCVTLVPILEKLAKEGKGKWNFVKVNVDDHAQLAADQKVRGIPAVKLYVDGEVINEFTGAFPEHEVRVWLQQNLPSGLDKEVSIAEQKLAHGDEISAIEVLEKVLNEDKNHIKANFLLGRLLVFEDATRATSLLTKAEKSSQFLNEILDIKVLISGLEKLKELNEVEDSQGSLEEALKDGLSYLAEKNFDKALEELISVVMKDKSYQNELPQKLCVSIFHYLGEDHSTTKKYRKRFDMVLY